MERWESRRVDDLVRYRKALACMARVMGVMELRGSRDAFRWALQAGVIDDKGWMKSIEARNLTSHDYDEDVAERVHDEIIRVYYPLFVRFEETMAGIEVREREEM